MTRENDLLKKAFLKGDALVTWFVTKNFISWIPKVLEVAREAANAIMEVRAHKNYQVKSKQDSSPVTEADLLANQILEEGLKSIKPGIPVLSEENETIPYKDRKHWSLFWLVDPLDGTQEFIKGSKDFTINIALIEHHQPILGVVMAPALQHYYWGCRNEAAYFQQADNEPEQIQVRSELSFPLKVAVSRSHDHSRSANAKWNALIQRFKEVEFVYRGSALKICLVAKGEVDLYPRLGPTGEWDTAAGQCILEAAGGQLVDLWGKPFKYNARETLENAGFFAVGCADLLSYIVDKSD